MGTTLALFGQAVNQQLCSERQRLTSPVNPSSESAASAYRAAFAQTDVDISGDGERAPIGLCSALTVLVLSCARRTRGTWFTRCGASSRNRSSWFPSRATPASTPAHSAATADTGISSRAAALRFPLCVPERRILFARK